MRHEWFRDPGIEDLRTHIEGRILTPMRAQRSGPDRVDGPRMSELTRNGERFLIISVPIVDTMTDLLTAAELQIARYVACGLRTREIAAKRGSSLSTVANQLASIYGKLGVAGRRELVAVMMGARRAEDDVERSRK